MTDMATAGAQAPAVFRSERPIYEVVLWPHRSLSARGFAAVMGFTGAMLALPLIPLAGSAVALGLAPFLVATFALLAWFIRRNARDGRLTETLRLWPDLMTVERREPSGRVLRWQADPYWVRLKMDPDGRPENYITLKGGGRIIELGAFLSPEERADLAAELEDAIATALAGGAPRDA